MLSLFVCLVCFPSPRLFPLREPGVNYMASELTKKEIEVSLYWESPSL